MEMINIHSGKLRAIGYDSSTRTLRIALDNGQGFEYSPIGESIWRQFKQSGNQWSYYRDNIETEYTAQPVSIKKENKPTKNPLDDLFK